MGPRLGSSSSTVLCGPELAVLVGIYIPRSVLPIEYVPAAMLEE